MVNPTEWNLSPREFSAGIDANGGAGRTYTGRIEHFSVAGRGGEPIGSAHAISYRLSEAVADDASGGSSRPAADAGPQKRPVIFIFNGGPGVSSVWLHLGGVGPFRVAVPEDPTSAFAPPYELEENAGSLLAAGDLVFIDPIRTGYGRLEVGADPAPVSGVDGDVSHVAEIIEEWLTRHGRLGSPVYLVGESYGTIRASLLTTALSQRSNAIAVSGVALIGQAVNAQETTQRPTNVVGFVAAVPYLAATAQYHGLGDYGSLGLAELTDRAHEWSLARYAPALLRGDLLSEEEAREIAGELAAFCGLSVEWLLENALRVNKEDFRRVLLPGRILGLTDARYTLPVAPHSLPGEEVDPTDVVLDPAYTALIHEHLVHSLGAPGDEVYRLAASGVHEGWDYQEAGATAAFGGSPLPSPFAQFDYAAHLRSWMRANPRARLFVGTGHYDSLTTVGAARHLLAQNALPRERVTFRAYAGGHMMYTVRSVAEQLGADLRRFITEEHDANEGNR